MDYSKSIKKLREMMFLTQEEFANEIGVKLITVSRWENGKFDPTIKNKRKLNDLFREYKIEVKIKENK